ncbi:hypothetical protein [Jiangella alkaliphila]|uniref:hypothetical protein n=1 Tax=Jiangella alkaliphila TaxID=419479 RepID=UPI0018D2CD99|nr:hypothetical protein [Jiangella alkaliphila]
MTNKLRPGDALKPESELARQFGATRRSAHTAPTPVVTGEYRLGDVRHVVASPACAAEVLGFMARVPFAAGVDEFAHAPLRA